MKRKHYILPSAYCADALAKYHAARTATLAARDALREKYGADAISCRGSKGDALGFKLEPGPIKGVGAAVREKGMYAVRPDHRTAAGKTLQAELDHVAELQDNWRWALERALGVDGAALDPRLKGEWHHINAVPVFDGRVALSWPIEVKGIAVPDCAQEITEVEYRVLTGAIEL